MNSGSTPTSTKFKQNFLDQFLTNPGGNELQELSNKSTYHLFNNIFTKFTLPADKENNLTPQMNKKINYYDKVFSHRQDYNNSKTINQENIQQNFFFSSNSNKDTTFGIAELSDMNKTPLWSMREDWEESKDTKRVTGFQVNTNIKKPLLKKSITPNNGINAYKNIIKEVKNGRGLNEAPKNKKNLSAINMNLGSIIGSMGGMTPTSKKIKSPIKIENNIIKSSKLQMKKDPKINSDFHQKTPKLEPRKIQRNVNLVKSNTKTGETKISISKSRTNSKGSLLGLIAQTKENSSPLRANQNAPINNKPIMSNPVSSKRVINPSNNNTNRVVPSLTGKTISSGGIIKKVKDLASQNQNQINLPQKGIKNKIFEENNIYQQADTIPDNNYINPPNQKLYFIGGKIEDENESETIKLGEENPSSSKINNTIDTKTDIYQILNNMNISNDFRFKESGIINTSNANSSRQDKRRESDPNKHVSFKVEDQKVVKESKFKNSENPLNPGAIVTQVYGSNHELKKEEEFIKNKYKSLLSEYFTN